MALVNEMTSTAASLLAAVPAQDAEPGSANSMPGLGSFIVFAFLAVALYFLLRNLNTRLRRMSYREKERQVTEAGTADANVDAGESPEPDEERGDTDREPRG